MEKESKVIFQREIHDKNKGRRKRANKNSRCALVPFCNKELRDQIAVKGSFSGGLQRVGERERVSGHKVTKQWVRDSLVCE